jgi:hypothetical protein
LNFENNSATSDSNLVNLFSTLSSEDSTAPIDKGDVGDAVAAPIDAEDKAVSSDF